MYEPFDRYYLTVCPTCGAFVKLVPMDYSQEKPADMYCGFCELIFRASEQDGILFKRWLTPAQRKARARKERQAEALNTDK